MSSSAFGTSNTAEQIASSARLVGNPAKPAVAPVSSKFHRCKTGTTIEISIEPATNTARPINNGYSLQHISVRHGYRGNRISK